MRENDDSRGSGEGGFVLDPFEPAYLGTYRSGGLGSRVRAARRELRECRVCPRKCRVDRLHNEMDFCRTGRYARVYSAFAHFGEEQCLRGWKGSGTIFFASCNLRCVFCQNADISQSPAGVECDAFAIATMMLGLQRQGCHNINLVTPEHVVPQVIEAIAAAIPLGLNLPIVYNTSAYDAVESLRLLDGIIDVYMPDFKFWTRENARRYVKAKDYPERAQEAIVEMHRQVGPLRFGPDGVARRGVLLRHLVMPGLVDESSAIFEWLAEALSPDTFVNIMGQYRPAHEVRMPGSDGRSRYAAIDRRPTRGEMESAYAAAHRAGLWRFDAL